MEKDGIWGALSVGDLHGAMAQMKDKEKERYLARFAQGESLDYGLPEVLEQMMACYQDYWRAVFYRQEDRDSAARALGTALARVLNGDPDMPLDELETGPVKAAFSAHDLYFLGGRTGGFYGPQVWKTQREQTFQVELPEGEAAYTIRFLDDFVVKGWLDYLSFGVVGVGGWADGDGVVCSTGDSDCIESEYFQVSFLKHEAQHVRDLARWPDLSQELLEYRAKLVELIYSRERKPLYFFQHQARAGFRQETGNGHALAAKRIVERIDPAGDIPAQALALFWESCKELENGNR